MESVCHQQVQRPPSNLLSASNVSYGMITSSLLGETHFGRMGNPEDPPMLIKTQEQSKGRKEESATWESFQVFCALHIICEASGFLSADSETNTRMPCFTCRNAPPATVARKHVPSGSLCPGKHAKTFRFFFSFHAMVAIGINTKEEKWLRREKSHVLKRIEEEGRNIKEETASDGMF